MRVLIAAKHPPGGSLPIGGVQTWSKTIGDELEKLGHEVVYWGPEWSLPEGRFDRGVFANLKFTCPALALCDKSVKVAHGVIPDEQGGPDFLATSEEVANKWRCRAVIRQPIDLGFWTPGEESRTLLVRHSYRDGLPFVKNIAAGMGLGFVHAKTMAPDALRSVLRRARVVVATGRAAVEAMACGSAVVVADARGYQQPLLDPDPIGAMRRNYSGRGGFVPNMDRMKKAIRDALARGSLRSHVERHHDAQRIVQELWSHF